MVDEMKERIVSLLKGIERYNPENLPTLEDYIDMQCKNNMYDLEANLALLKLYQFNPLISNPIFVQKVLCKALTKLPHSDFVLCKAILNPDIAEQPEIEVIMKLNNLLETGHFEKYWAFYSDEALQKITALKEIEGYEDSIRRFICYVIGITYQHIDKILLSTFLGGLTGPQFQFWLDKNGWKNVDNKLIFIEDQENIVVPKHTEERITFDDISPMMKAFQLANLEKFKKFDY